jgi:uncharacterized protein (TIGR03032 family)
LQLVAILESKPPQQISLRVSSGLADWLWAEGISIVISAYQSGQLISIGASEPGKLAARSIRFDRSMGLAQDRSGLWVATLNRIWRFAVMKAEAKTARPHDVYLVPQVAYVTGFVNAHDLAIGPQQRPVFAAAMFNCIATTTANASLVPLWHPAFIKDRKPGDACHLNGLALKDGVAQCVTVLEQSSEPGAWRKDPNGGAIIDVASNRAVVTGLAQPHSPRFHAGRLWLHQSSQGAFGYVDGDRYMELMRCPGYLRGLAFHKNIACMGMSKPRGIANVGGKALTEQLRERNLEPACAVLFFDLDKGSVIHSLQLNEIDEIYDVAVLTWRNPYLVDPSSAEASTTYLIANQTTRERQQPEHHDQRQGSR